MLHVMTYSVLLYDDDISFKVVCSLGNCGSLIFACTYLTRTLTYSPIYTGICMYSSCHVCTYTYRVYVISCWYIYREDGQKVGVGALFRILNTVHGSSNHGNR